MSDSLNYNLIFTDGACRGNPGPGGWGFVLVTPDAQVQEGGGYAEMTSNNRMEITAVIKALKLLNQNSKNIQKPIHVYSDSTYVLRGMTQWIWGWIRKGWINSEGLEVSNKDLWLELHNLVRKIESQTKIKWLYSRGHIGTPGNERCDQIAVAMSEKKWVDLYHGPLMNYSVAIFDLPEETDLPEIKPKNEKTVAYSYLSYLNREVWRHSDWASCERRVKGQSGARFKKALQKSDEAKILEEWGLSKDAIIKE